MNELKTIRVTGRGLIRLKPDTTRITLTIEGISPDYTMLLQSSASDTARFRGALETVGFAREDLKTLQFQVQPEYEGHQEDGVYKQRLTGFRFLHELSFAFPSENERLERVLAALAGTGLRPEFSISFTVKDREAAKNALLNAAVADAKAKAETLAAASGVTLLGIRHIRYSMNESEFAVHPVNRSVFAAKASADRFAPEIEPKEIEAQDTVSIVWEIE
jgi:uncharacterized protein YggE